MRQNPWIKCYQPRPAARLRCSASPMPGVPLRPFMPGRGICPSRSKWWRFNCRDAKTVFAKSRIIASHHWWDSRAVIAERCDIPFAFFGHSMGGLIAFELARYLRQAAARYPNGYSYQAAGRRTSQIHCRRFPICPTRSSCENCSSATGDFPTRLPATRNCDPCFSP